MTQSPGSGSRTLRTTAGAVARVLILGLAVHLLLPQIATLEQSARILRSLAWYAVAAAVFSQMLSYAGSGYEVQQILASYGQQVRLRRCLAMVMGSFSLSLVGGGQLTTSGSMYRWLRASGATADSALVAGVLPALINLATIGAVSVAGVLYLLAVHRLPSGIAVALALALSLLFSATLFLWVGLHYRAWFAAFVDDLGRRWARFRHRPYSSDALTGSVERLFRGADVIVSGGWRRPVAGDVVNVGFDFLTLYLLFLAAHYVPNPAMVVAGYGLPMLAAKVTPIHGGLGVVEGGMVGLFLGLGAPNGIAVIVTLSYRLVSFWIPALIGFGAALTLSRAGSADGEATVQS